MRHFFTAWLFVHAMSYHYVVCVYRDKSDLTATYREVAVLGEVLVNSISY